MPSIIPFPPPPSPYTYGDTMMDISTMQYRSVNKNQCFTVAYFILVIKIKKNIYDCLSLLIKTRWLTTTKSASCKLATLFEYHVLVSF